MPFQKTELNSVKNYKMWYFPWVTKYTAVEEQQKRGSQCPEPGMVETMVPISDGNLEQVAHAWRKIGLFWKIRLVTTLDLIKCLEQIK